MNMESKYFMKKISRIPLIVVGIIFILISLMLEAYIIYDYNNETKNVKQFDETQISGSYVYVDVSDVSTSFATYKNDDTTQHYYFLVDKNKTFYIGKIPDNKYKKLPGKLYGYKTTIPMDLIPIAKSSINELSGEDVVTSENFYKVFSSYYIDAYKAPSDDLIGFSIIISILFIIGLSFVIVSIIKKSKSSKIIKEYGQDKLFSEIDSEKTLAYHEGKLYFTQEYILCYDSVIKMIKYDDIIWIYPHTVRYNGSTTATISVMRNNGKIESICPMSLRKNTQSKFDEIYQNIISKAPRVLSGYTAENMDKANEMVDKYKLKK